jgi:tetratricopeptide (TPR) repeat protein
MPERRAAARALLARCEAAWHTDPAAVAQAASEARALAEQARAERGDPADPAAQAEAAELEALAGWAEAAVDLAQQRLEAAAARLAAVHAALAGLGLAADAARAQVPLVAALSLLGRFDEALAVAGQARAALLAEGDVRAAAKVVLNTGSLSLMQDRHADAAGHYAEAARLFARVGDRANSVLADIGAGDAQAYGGDLHGAQLLYRRALERAATHGLPVAASTAALALAETALAEGRHDEALAGLARASEAFAALGLPLVQAEAERALADAYLELGLRAEASRLYADVLRHAGEASPTAAWAWLQRARIHAGDGELDAAATAIDRAEALFTAHGNALGPGATALARAALALAAGQAGAAVAAADAALQRLPSPVPQAGAAQLIRAQAILADGRTAPADRAAAEAALHRLATGGGAAAPLTLREPAWLALGRCHRARGEREAARAAFEQAMLAAEAVRSRLPGDDWQRGWLRERGGAHEELLRLALDEAAAAPAAEAPAAAPAAEAPAAAEAVLVAAERLRARALRERLHAGGPAPHDTEGDEPPRITALRTRLDWIYRRQSRSLREDDGDELPGALAAERDAIEHLLLEQARRLGLAGRAAPPSAPSAPSPALPSVAAGDGAEARDATAATGPGLAARLHAALGPDRALVAYVACDGRWHALVAARGALRLHALPATPEAVDTLRRALAIQVATQRLPRERLARHAGQMAARQAQVLRRLHASLWAPFAQSLAGIERVCVVPGSGLGAVPFPALEDEAGAIGARHRFALLASVDRLWHAAPASPLPRDAEVAAFGDTLRLPGVAAELAAVAAAWPAARLHAGAEATVAAVRGARGVRLLHVACHGEFREDNPQFSALHLADGTLSALAAERLRLDGAIVVLSACDTARVDDTRGDEALGLVRAFLVAGAARVIAGIWPVDDRATARFMAALHAELAAGVTAGVALAEVARRARAEGEPLLVHGAFVLHGGD